MKSKKNQDRVAEAEKFFDTLFGNVTGGHWGYLWTIQGKKTYPFDVTTAQSRHEMALAAIKLSDDGKDVYVGVNVGDEKPVSNKRYTAEQITVQTATITDIDVEGGNHISTDKILYAPTFDKAKSYLPFDVSLLVDSGYGLHGYCVYAEPVFVTDTNRADILSRNGKFINVIRHNADVYHKAVDSVGDLSRILRVPGTYNYKLGKEGAPLCRLVEVSDVRFTPTELDARLNALLPTTSTQQFAPADNIPNQSARPQYHSDADTPSEQERALAMLERIPAADLTRDEWVDIGMALKNNGNDVSDWEQWSRPDVRFKDGECERLWNGFNRGGKTIATIHDIAKNYGYDEKTFLREWHAERRRSSQVTKPVKTSTPAADVTSTTAKPSTGEVTAEPSDVDNQITPPPAFLPQKTKNAIIEWQQIHGKINPATLDKLAERATKRKYDILFDFMSTDTRKWISGFQYYDFFDDVRQELIQTWHDEGINQGEAAKPDDWEKFERDVAEAYAQCKKNHEKYLASLKDNHSAAQVDSTTQADVTSTNAPNEPDEFKAAADEWEAAFGKIDPDVRPKICAAMEYLQTLDEKTITVDNALSTKTKQALALCDCYSFAKSAVVKFFAALTRAKNAATATLKDQRAAGCDFIAFDAEASELSQVPIRELKAGVEKQMSKLQKAHENFQKQEQRRIADEEYQRKKAKRDAIVAEAKSKLRELKKAKPSKERDAALVVNIGRACEWRKDFHGTPIAVKATAANGDLIFGYDPDIDGLVGYDEFQQADVLLRPAPWRKSSKAGDEWTDRDDEQCQLLIRRRYIEFANEKLYRQLLTSYSDSRAFHVIKDYFNNLPAWDGTPRAEDLFIKFLRVDDTPFARAVTLNWLTASVARIFRPGCPYQTALVLLGNQGVGKSFILKRLGGEWCGTLSDSVDDPHAIDAIRKLWLVEIKEGYAWSRADAAAQKRFIDCSADTRRSAYQHRAATVKRHCTFAITTNAEQLFSDMTGNRRYLVLRSNSQQGDYVKGLTDEYVKQIWAEIYQRYKENFADLSDLELGAALELSRELRAEAEKINQGYLRDDGLDGEIRAFLDRPVLPDVIRNLLTKDEIHKFFDKGFLEISGGEEELNYRRRAKGGRNIQADIDEIYSIVHNKNICRNTPTNFTPQAIRIYGNVRRKTVCSAEIFNEAFGNDKRKSMLRIHEILARLDDWKLSGRQVNDPVYGNQKRVYCRVVDDEPSDNSPVVVDNSNSLPEKNSDSPQPTAMKNPQPAADSAATNFATVQPPSTADFDEPQHDESYHDDPLYDDSSFDESSNVSTFSPDDMPF